MLLLNEQIAIGAIAIFLCLADWLVKSLIRPLNKDDLQLQPYSRRGVRKISFMEVTESICFSAIPYAYGIVILTYLRGVLNVDQTNQDIVHAQILMFVLLTIMPATYCVCLYMHKVIDKANVRKKNSVASVFFKIIDLPNAVLNWFILFNVGFYLFKAIAKTG